MVHEHDLARAAALLRSAKALLVCAGAGMGVDSGLPDFRGNTGFWQAYPGLHAAGIAFHEIANPASFASDPRLAWGFYGHRLALYRATRPHAGFAILRRLGARVDGGAFVFTSNVDGHFGRAGFSSDGIIECHGSIHHLQCTLPCSDAIWPADEINPEVDTVHCRLLSPLPRCPQCGALARPNILMFNDSAWIETRTEAQYARMRHWRRQACGLVVVELGAGVDIPSVRRMGEAQGAPLIRINPRAPQLDGHAGVALGHGALASLQAIEKLI
ncbi:NAD-dependent deacetylase [Massilia sp. Dwa41.01b]|nr:NAD-dependent deacetylase [Massilia sp. Dwa41.01b]